MGNRVQADVHTESEPDDSKLESSQSNRMELDVASLSSPTLTRLIEEVRNEATIGRAYNRSYHRHNR